VYKRQRKDVPQITVISVPHDNYGCRYYEQFTRDDYEQFTIKEREAFGWYINHIKNSTRDVSFLDLLFGLQAGRILFAGPVLIDGSSRLIPYTGACIPGRKIFVDVSGNYHICERINESYPIGDIRSGLDFSRITSFIDNYKSHLDQCPSCTINKLCNFCYCQFVTGGECKFSSDVCINPVENHKKQLARAFTIAEVNPQFPEFVTEDYYIWLSGISSTFED